MIKKCQQLNVLREFLNQKVHFRHKKIRKIVKEKCENQTNNK